MSGKRVDFAVAAVTELQQANEWLSERSPAAAEVLRQAVTRVAERLSQFPHSGPLWTDFKTTSAVRRIIVPQTSYCLFYTVETDRIIVVSVAHTSRDPGYWLRR